MDDVSIRDRDGDRDRTHAHARARDLEFVDDRARATLARSLARSLDRPTLRSVKRRVAPSSIIHPPPDDTTTTIVSRRPPRSRPRVARRHRSYVRKSSSSAVETSEGDGRRSSREEGGDVDAMTIGALDDECWANRPSDVLTRHTSTTGDGRRGRGRGVDACEDACRDRAERWTRRERCAREVDEGRD